MSAPSANPPMDPGVVIAQLAQRVSQLENELKAKNKLLETASNSDYPTASLSVPPHLAQTEKKIVAPTPPNSIAASGVTSPAFHSANASMISTRAVSPLIFEENESLAGMDVDVDDPDLRAAIALSLQSEYDSKKGSHATPAPVAAQTSSASASQHSSPSHGPAPLPATASLASAVSLPKPQPVPASPTPVVSHSTPAPPPAAPAPVPTVSISQPQPVLSAPPSVASVAPSGKAEAKDEPDVSGDSTDPTNKKRKMQNLLDEYKVFEAEKAKIEEDYIAEQTKLVEEFEARAKRVFEVYDAKKLPHAEALGKLKKPICDLLDGAYVELQAKTIDSCYTDMHNRFPRYTRTYYGWGAAGARGTTAGLLGRTDSGEPDIFAVIQHLKEKREKALHEEQEKKRQELEKQVSEQREAQKKSERAEKALITVIPMVPHLTLDQACRALEIHKDDQARTLDWLLTTDLEQVYARLTAPPTAAETAAKAVPMDTDLVEDPGMLPSQASMLPYRTPKLSRLNTEGGEKHVICKVLKVLDDATVEMRMVLDRNRIPCDPVAATRHVVPLAKLVEDPEFRIPSAAECLLIEEDKQKRVPVITFQVVGDELQPISINPPIRIGEYNLDWDSHNKLLRSVRHQNDGAILFKTVHDEADGLHVTFDYSSPVELYTQAIDAVTHNIVHMHLDDTRDDVAVDTVNLTGSDEKVEDKMKFEKDATGRQLAYRIVVRDEKVIAVLYRFGNEIKKGVFVEHQVPAVGSLVYLPGDKYATVTSIPVGLVVTTNPRDIEKPAEPAGLKRAAPCARKHPAEMTGFLVVSIIAEKGQIFDNPVEESLPVCQVKIATPDQHAMLESLRDSKVNSLLGTITSKLEIIEAAVDGRSSTPVSELSELRRQIAELQLQPQTAALLDANYKQRINKAFNALRLMALNARTPTKQ